MTVPLGTGAAFGYSLWDFARALKCSELPSVQRHLLHVMALTPAKGSDGVCAGPDFSYPRLAAATGYSRATVASNLAKLANTPWLDRLSNGTGRRNSYRLRMPPPAVPREAPETIPNPSSSQTGSPPEVIPNPSSSQTGTRPAARRDPSSCQTPSFPLLTKVPSIDQSVRTRIRLACPDLTPDDDDLAVLITNLETRAHKPVRNVAAYLQTCPPADIRRLLAEASAPNPQFSEGTSTNATGSAVPEIDCVHGFPGGASLTRARTPRCPECRTAARLSASPPFTPSLDGLDQRAPADAAQGISAPVSVTA